MKTFKEAAAAFEAVQNKYGDFGASDTEPDYEFQAVLRRVYDRRDPQVPSTVTGWQLFDDMPGVGKAARALTAAAHAAVEAAAADPVGFGDWMPAGNAWRVM